MIQRVYLLSCLLVAVCFAQETATLTVPRPGFKDIPFGTPKEAVFRRLVFAHNFKQINAKQAEKRGVLVQEILDQDSCGISKMNSGNHVLSLKFHFNHEKKFCGFSFFFPGKPMESYDSEVREEAAFLFKLFDDKYGATFLSPPLSDSVKIAGSVICGERVSDNLKITGAVFFSKKDGYYPETSVFD